MAIGEWETEVYGKRDTSQMDFAGSILACTEQGSGSIKPKCLPSGTTVSLYGKGRPNLPTRYFDYNYCGDDPFGLILRLGPARWDTKYVGPMASIH